MSKPEDIPQSVWEAAFEPGENAYMALKWMDAQAIVARAMMSAAAKEREACAQTADDHLDRFGYAGVIQSKGWDGLRQIVCNAIRKRGEA